MATQPMKLTLSASTGARIQVWRDEDLFHAVLLDELAPPQVCLGVDLFEVVAELGGLDLEDAAQAAEATRLAEQAQARFAPAEPATPAATAAEQDPSEAKGRHGG